MSNKPYLQSEIRILLWMNLVPNGGARRDRTDDLLLAKQALSQLSYGPFRRVRGLRTEAAEATKVGGPGKT